jgi:hypothetical protein
MHNKIKLITSVAFLLTVTTLTSGCASTPPQPPEVTRSISRDVTMSNMAKTALISEMLNSPDPHVRSRGAAVAETFLTPVKEQPKSLWPFVVSK